MPQVRLLMQADTTPDCKQAAMRLFLEGPCIHHERRKQPCSHDAICCLCVRGRRTGLQSLIDVTQGGSGG